MEQREILREIEENFHGNFWGNLTEVNRTQYYKWFKSGCQLVEDDPSWWYLRSEIFASRSTSQPWMIYNYFATVKRKNSQELSPCQCACSFSLVNSPVLSWKLDDCSPQPCYYPALAPCNISYSQNWHQCWKDAVVTALMT